VLSVELHTHSEHSYDGRDPVERLLARAAALDLDAIAVTDHDEMAGSREAVALAPEYDLLAIPGLEVSSAAGHVLALGVDDLVPADLSFHATIDRIHDQGGIAVVPHPFQKSRSGVLANVDPADLAAADAIEVYNSRLLTGRANRKATRYARRNNVPMTAGSDAHISEMVGQALTLVDADEPTVDGILAAIAAGRTTVEGRRTPWHISFKQAAGGVKRRVATRVTSLLE
jgi:hypothetical protein